MFQYPLDVETKASLSFYEIDWQSRLDEPGLETDAFRYRINIYRSG